MSRTLATLAASALPYGFHRDVAKIPGVNREKVCVDGVFGVWLQVYGDHYRENRHLVQVGGEAVPADVRLILRDLEFSFHCVPLRIHYSIQAGFPIPPTESIEHFEGFTLEREREDTSHPIPSALVIWPNIGQEYQVAKGIYLVLDLISTYFRWSRQNHTDQVRSEHRAVLGLFLHALRLVAPHRPFTLDLEFGQSLSFDLTRQVQLQPNFRTKWLPAVKHFIEKENIHSIAESAARFASNQNKIPPFNYAPESRLHASVMGSLFDVHQVLQPLLTPVPPAQAIPILDYTRAPRSGHQPPPLAHFQPMSRNHLNPF